MSRGFSIWRQHSSHSDVLKVFRLGRFLITLVATILALFFTWLQLKDVRIDVVIENTKPEFLQKLTLIIYYFCWLFGSRADVNAQEAVYVSVPLTWRVTAPEISLVAIFAALAGALLWATGDEKRFALLLSSFVAFNVLGWWYLNYKLKSLMSGSRTRLNKDKAFVDLERLNVVTNYLTGVWQWRRFVTLGLLIVAIDLVCFVPAVREFLSDLIVYLIADLQSKRDQVVKLLPDLLFLLFVLMGESWIWTKRVRVATALSVLDEMKHRYRLSKR